MSTSDHFSTKTMKLLYSPASPFARKVRIVLREKNLLVATEEIIASGHDNGADLLGLNPLAKVPALQTPQGGLFDSPLICEYLDGLSSVQPMLPAAFDARIAALRLQALADGVMDAAVASLFELRRPAAEQSAHWLQRWENAIRRGTAAIAADELPTTMQLGGVAAACALAYLSFRFPAIAWRTEHPALAGWFDVYTDRASFALTAPPQT